MANETLERRLTANAGIYWTGDNLERLSRHYGVPMHNASVARARSVPSTFTPVQLRSTGDAKTFSATISSPRVDRHSDSIAISAWTTASYSRNPIVLFNHNANLPIGRATKVFVNGSRLRAEFQFSDDPEALRVRNLTENGYIFSCSVGFIPAGDWAFSKDPERQHGIDFKTGCDLVEFSIVSVPSNVDATIDTPQQAKAHNAAHARARIRAKLERDFEIAALRKGAA
jgi:HK97 family phage prohead protease